MISNTWLLAEQWAGQSFGDQIAAARADGSLTGPISASFIQNISTRQAASDQFNSHQAEIPASVLNEALSWIKSNPQQIGASAT